MTVLSSLKLVFAQRSTAMSAVQYRRHKLSQKLQEQIAVTVHALWCGFETSRGSNGKRTVIGRRAKPWLQISRMIDAELIPSCWSVPTMVKIMGRKRSP